MQAARRAAREGSCALKVRGDVLNCTSTTSGGLTIYIYIFARPRPVLCARRVGVLPPGVYRFTARAASALTILRHAARQEAVIFRGTGAETRPPRLGAGRPAWRRHVQLARRSDAAQLTRHLLGASAVGAARRWPAGASGHRGRAAPARSRPQEGLRCHLAGAAQVVQLRLPCCAGQGDLCRWLRRSGAAASRAGALALPGAAAADVARQASQRNRAAAR